MKHRLLSTALIAGVTALSPAVALEGIQYPSAPPANQTDDYHGTRVSDSYRWLEDYSDQTNAWIQAEAALTRSYLDAIPEREGIKRRLTELWDYEKYGAPTSERGHYFYTRNDGLQNQSVLYVRDSLRGTPRVLLDPNTLSRDGTIALAGTSVSHDAKYLAYAVSEAGSDWDTWRMRDIVTGSDLPDEIRWAKFCEASWSKDNKGFFYSRFKPPREGEDLKAANTFHRIYYHALGSLQETDRLIYERENQPHWTMQGQATDDGAYLIIQVEPGDKTEDGIFYKSLHKSDTPVIELLNRFDAHYDFIANEGSVFWIKSDLDAPRGRVWAIDVSRPQRENWKEVIPQGDDSLQSVSLVGDRFFCSYLHDARTRVRLCDLTGKMAGEVDLPGLGSAYGFDGKRGDVETFYAYSSYTTPTAIYRYDLAGGKSELFASPHLRFNPDEYESKQVFYPSKDGARIPMFISYKKAIQLDVPHPTILYGYGGFNISLMPAFFSQNLLWMEMGGVGAVANLRGGGEYGDSWHRAGMKTHKQTVFDDFIAGAEYLIHEKYTASNRLAIEGRSNGGLLVGACLNQRPELFGAALAGVGVMDMLRFPKFTIGSSWVGEYGACENADEFKALFAYSPYHNIRRGVCYPPTLITTADHDDRVYPAHSFKYAAALQAVQSKVAACSNPVLIRIETRAGHGAGKPTAKRIDEATDEWAFLVKALRMQPTVGSPKP